MSFTPIRFPDEQVSYLCPTWDEMESLAYAVSQKIKESHSQLDRIVTLARGGWPMSRSLVDFLEVPAVASMGIKFYKGVNERFEQPLVYQELPVSVAGESVVLFDDVADTGGSLRYAQEYLQQAQVKSVVTATLFYKPKSVIKPDYYGRETNSWIIFPYENRESVKLLKQIWEGKGIPNMEIKKRLVELNFLERDVAGIIE